MAANTTTAFQVTCPMHEGRCGELVEATTTFEATTVNVAACQNLLAQGWGNEPQAVLWKSQIDRYVPEQSVWQHRDGLVTFAGALA